MSRLHVRDRPYARLWATAAALPVLSHGSALFVIVDAVRWTDLAAQVRWSMAADAMLHTAIAIIVAAPIAGVAAAAAGRDARNGGRVGLPRAIATAAAFAGAVAAFTLVSATLSLGWRAGQPGGAALVLQSHTALFCVALALAAWGALCGAWFRDPLDSAAAGVGVSLVAAAGLLISGGAVADMPRTLLSWGLIANPLLVIASAAHIDIVRMDLLYRISPLAHIQFDYPSWGGSCVWYVGAALLCIAGMTFKSRTPATASAA